jgi:hypothetical protein
MISAVIDRDESPGHGKLRFGIMGFAYAVAVYRIPAFLVGSYIISTEIADLMTASFLIQFVVGASLSLIAYVTATNTSLKMGMRVCYASIASLLFVFGGFTMVTSL